MISIRKEFKSHRICLEHQLGRRFHCFGTPIWPWRRHVKTLYRVIGLATVAVKTLDSAILRINHNTADNYLGNSLGVVI